MILKTFLPPCFVLEALRIFSKSSNIKMLKLFKILKFHQIIANHVVNASILISNSSKNCSKNLKLFKGVLKN